ncbi:pirin family protein [Dongia deserti]|uniref:pirin family protein n=1 Tax=Dongia deserti TaxID=2268030 RepID=UPI000E64D2C8|nr:pirin family protein [Dongia deserti]
MEPVLVINAKIRDIGGFPVRRALPAIERRMIGPFIFLDQMGPTQLAAGQRLNVRPHPHIGLSTMTYLLEGKILHRDSLGTVQMIRPGAVNWMTAGGGIAHSERTPADAGDDMLAGIQFWVALPKSREEMAATFLHLDSGDLPVIEDGRVSARLIAGEAFGARSPLSAPHPMICMDVAMVPEASFEPPTSYAERALYVVGGQIELAGIRCGQGQLLVLPSGSIGVVRALSDARLIVLGGEPMDGPRHIWWNFVSSSKERIEQAKQDWKLGRFPAVPGETEFIPLPE